MYLGIHETVTNVRNNVSEKYCINLSLITSSSNVNLDKEYSREMDFSSLIFLKCLSMNHCSLRNLSIVKSQLVNFTILIIESF